MRSLISILYSSQKKARYEDHGVDRGNKVESEDEECETMRHCDGRDGPNFAGPEDLEAENQ